MLRLYRAQSVGCAIVAVVDIDGSPAGILASDNAGMVRSILGFDSDHTHNRPVLHLTFTQHSLNTHSHVGRVYDITREA